VTPQHETLVTVSSDDTGDWYTIVLECDRHDPLTFTLPVTHLPSLARVANKLCERLGMAVDDKMTIVDLANGEQQHTVDRLSEDLRRRRRPH